MLPIPCRFLLALLASGVLISGKQSAVADIIIAEIDAVNVGTINDVNGDQADWIELRNPDPAGVSLAGWALTDDAAVPGKWVFPAVTLNANSQMLVFASAKNRAIAGIQLHTNFKLGESGVVRL